MTVEETILTAIHEISSRKPKPITDVKREHRLIADVGLDSMDIAELVALLEERLGKDPFAEYASIADVRTVGDLVAVYER